MKRNPSEYTKDNIFPIEYLSRIKMGQNMEDPSIENLCYHGARFLEAFGPYQKGEEVDSLFFSFEEGTMWSGKKMAVVKLLVDRYPSWLDEALNSGDGTYKP